MFLMVVPRTRVGPHKLKNQALYRLLTTCVWFLQVLRAEVELNKGKMEEVRALAHELMSTRGENCQAQVGPKVEQLNLRFDIISQRIASGQVGTILTADCSN